MRSDWKITIIILLFDKENGTLNFTFLSEFYGLRSVSYVKVAVQRILPFRV